MTQTILISIGAGLLSALLFGSVLAGAFAALLLPLFAQLPLQIASLTFGPRSGVIAALAAAIAIVVAAGLIEISVPYALNVAVPAVIASYLVALRNTDLEEANIAAWFPMGRVLSTVAVTSVVCVILIGLHIGFNPQTAASAIQPQAEAMLLGAINAGQITPDIIRDAVSIFVAVLPFVAASALVLITALNLALAIRVARRYGAFKRPATSIATLEFPKLMYVTALFAIAVIWISGEATPILAVVAGASVSLVVIAGFAALHALTQKMAARGIVLIAVYGSIVFFGFPILLILALGWLDGFFNLRGRFAPGTPNS